jgi:hypothetical protein
MEKTFVALMDLPPEVRRGDRMQLQDRRVRAAPRLSAHRANSPPARVFRPPNVHVNGLPVRSHTNTVRQITPMAYVHLTGTEVTARYAADDEIAIAAGGEAVGGVSSPRRTHVSDELQLRNFRGSQATPRPILRRAVFGTEVASTVPSGASTCSNAQRRSDPCRASVCHPPAHRELFCDGKFVGRPN